MKTPDTETTERPFTAAYDAALAAWETAAATYTTAEQAWIDDESASEDDATALSRVTYDAAAREQDMATEQLAAAREALYLSDEPCTYTLRDRESGVELEITASSDADARKQALAWGREGYEPSEHTFWVDVRITDLLGQSEDVTIQVDPEEPDCVRGNVHDWRAPHSVLGGLKESPGVQGHGGGVVYKEVCRHCGAYRVIDTWAQRPDTGKQGLTSVEYSDSDDESLAWVARKDAAELAEHVETWGEPRVKAGRIYLSVDAGEDDDADDATMDEIRASLPDGWTATWTGSSNTDANGETTLDVEIERAS